MMLYHVFLEYLDNISSIDKLHYFVLVNRFFVYSLAPRSNSLARSPIDESIVNSAFFVSEMKLISLDSASYKRASAPKTCLG